MSDLHVQLTRNLVVLSSVSQRIHSAKFSMTQFQVSFDSIIHFIDPNSLAKLGHLFFLWTKVVKFKMFTFCM